MFSLFDKLHVPSTHGGVGEHPQVIGELVPTFTSFTRLQMSHMLPDSNTIVNRVGIYRQRLI